MDYFNHIYEHFNPVALEIFGIKIHWYGIAYVFSLVLALYLAKFFAKRDDRFHRISPKLLESYFLWVEVGIILGARVGYILIYSPHTSFYLSNPWQIFNPFDVNGNFVGISGMSYHGGLVGFLIGSILFAKFRKQNLLNYLDLVALSIPLAYVLGRIGNFLNQELYGRPVDSYSVFGIYVDGVLRYPSQLIEAFLEGIVVFVLVLIARRFLKFDGGLIFVYALGYGVARFVAEYFREPDVQIGYIYGFSMGQILSVLMFFASFIVLFYAKNKNKGNKKI